MQSIELAPSVSVFKLRKSRLWMLTNASGLNNEARDRLKLTGREDTRPRRCSYKRWGPTSRNSQRGKNSNWHIATVKLATTGNPFVLSRTGSHGSLLLADSGWSPRKW